jgi:predicted phage tail protein
MYKKITVFILSGLLLLNIYGCFTLFVGAAAGTGTAVWLSGKLAQEFNAPYERTINAAQKALRSLKLEVRKESKQANITQLKSKYSNGKEIWIDVRKVTDSSSKVEVRVGAVSSDKEAATKILNRIQSYL